MNNSTFLAATLAAFTLIFSVGARAQSADAPSKVEIGVQFSSVTIVPQWPNTGLGLAVGGSEISEAGFGGRFTFNLNRNFALEAEGNFFPHENFNEPAAGGQLTQGLFGLKAGKRFGKFGLFAKARPGFAHVTKAIAQLDTVVVDFNGTPITFPIYGRRSKTHFSMDLGGVLEFYPSRKVLTRFDVGDTIIRYGNGSFFPTGFAPTSRTSHNLQISAGIGFRLGFLPPDEARPQTHDDRQRFEVGAQFSSFGFTQVEPSAGSPSVDFRDTRTQPGFGGRFTYNVTSNFALEAQGDFFPRDAQLFNTGRAGGRTLQLQAGTKLGKRFERFGIFGKARPGVVSFSRTISFDGFENDQGFLIPLFHEKRSSYFSLDLGGVLEFYPSRRLVTRFDAGDTMIRYRSIQLPIGFNGMITAPAEMIHSFEFSAGVGFRF